jgi:uncharacterized protein (TIGR00106 family)
LGKVIAEISIIPLGTGTPSVSEYIGEAVKIIKSRGIPYRVCPMGTVVEGELDEVLDLLRDIHEAPFLMGAQRVVTRLVIDERRDKPASMGQKVNSVKERVGEQDDVE